MMEEASNTSSTSEETAKKAKTPKEIKGQSSFEGSLKSIYKHYSGTIWILILYLTMLGYPGIVNWANPAPPKNQLQWISGKVVFAKRTHPNIRLEVADGSKQDFDFYADLTAMIRGVVPITAVSDQELSKFEGCQAEIGVVPIKWLIFPYNNRVWEIRSNCLSVPYELLIEKSQQNFKSRFWGRMILHISFVVFTIFIFILERRKKWASVTV